MTAVQLDIFGALEEVRLAQAPACLYASPARGLVARTAEFEAWREQYGSFGCLVRAHAWTPALGGDSKAPTERCQATTLHVDLRPAEGYDFACDCTRADALLYRGACRHCDWEGPECRGENLAAEDGLDHAWPGWRDLPVVPGVPAENAPRDKYARGRWVAEVAALYPAGWLKSGGPIRTLRKGPYGNRHVPGRTPFGGYDAGVPEVAETA